MGTFKKNSLNKLVAEQLANELVQEMAELEKRQAVVNSIKEKICNMKKLIIGNLVEDSVFRIEGKKQIVLHHSFQTYINTMEVEMTFGIMPEEVLKMYPKLTKKEEELLGEYKKSFDRCCYGMLQEAGLKAEEIARKIILLRNRINLTNRIVWQIDLGSATEPGFFESSGLEIRNIYKNISVSNNEKITLENYKVRISNK